MERIIADVEEGGRQLAEAFAAARRAVVFTGAGISTESGIPDYRSPGGLWTKMEPIQFEDFLASEAARLEDWRRRLMMRDTFAAATPNAAHRAIAHLVTNGTVRAVVTQNIDGLHARSGVPAERLIELHGVGTHAHCLACGRRMELDEAAAIIAATGAAPRCPACDGLVKSAVVSFGEPMPEAAMRLAQRYAAEADLMVAAGSSLVVWPAAGIPLVAKRMGARLIIANRDPTGLDSEADLVLRGPIGALFAPLDPGPAPAASVAALPQCGG